MFQLWIPSPKPPPPPPAPPWTEEALKQWGQDWGKRLSRNINESKAFYAEILAFSQPLAAPTNALYETALTWMGVAFYEYYTGAWSRYRAAGQIAEAVERLRLAGGGCIKPE